MTAARKIAFDGRPAPNAEIVAGRDAAPAITIDVEAAEIVSANAAGAEAWGLFPYATFPIAIDPGTPALVRLRKIASEIELPSEEWLAFPVNGQLRRMTFLVSSVGSAPGRRLVELIVRGSLPEGEGRGESLPDGKTDVAGTAAPAPEGMNGADRHRSAADALRHIAVEICRRASEAHAREQEDAGAAEHIDKARVAEPAAAPLPSQSERQANALPLLDPDQLARLAHELKTPLTAIAAAAEIMRDERLGAMGNARYLSYASDIHESAHHALDVITALLSESGTSNDGAPRLIALDLNAIVARTVSSMQALSQTHGLLLAFDAGQNQPHVVANPTALRQILLNLLTNSVKFTPPGGDVRVVTGHLDDGRVFLVVRDTGRGMTGAKDVVGTALSSAQRLSAGNGMGLPMVRRLVSEMGGELQIDSVPGKGTTMLIAFGCHASWPSPASPPESA